MRRFSVLFLIAAVAMVFAAGCSSSVEDLPAVTISDNDGEVEPRVVTVGYVNDRLDRVPADMIPDTPGDAGKREFIEEIIRKELLVIYGTKLGILEDDRLPGALKHFEDSKAEEMLRDKLINDPAAVSEDDVIDYYAVRDDLFQLQEIVVDTEEEAAEVYRRATEGGEDFGKLVAEVSRGSSLQDEGRLPVAAWMDLHPLTRVATRYLDKDDITEPYRIGSGMFIYKVISRKDPAIVKPLEGSHLTGITAEAKNFNRNMLEYYTFRDWMDAANAVFNDEGIDVCGTRTEEAVLRTIPQDEATTAEERMDRARMVVIPEFTEEEADIVLVTYNIDGDERVVTLADYAILLSEVPGIETLKSGERERIETFMKRRIQKQSIQHNIDLAGYRDSPEMADYLEQRTEEFIIDIAYDQEVVQKVDEPTGEEIREYYRSNLDYYVVPVGVDVQQLIVSTEQQANLIRQRLESGEATFTDMVQTHSIDEWSKAKDGKIENYRQGEGRLDYLQMVAFDLEVGEVSEAVRAPGGYALVKVLAKHPSRQMSFDEVGEAVRQAVIATKREALLTQLLENARNSVTIDYAEENFQHIKDPAEVLKEKTEG